MRSNSLKATLKTAVLAATILLLGVSAALAQLQQVNLAAAPTTATLPDGSTVPMWGYICGTAVSGATATCAKSNPLALAVTTSTGLPGWSPVVITVPAGQDLQINLTNAMTFAPGTGPNSVPTSLVIVGQLGGGLRTTATSTAAPDHSMAQQLTWPIAAPGVAANTPPAQGPRV